MTILAIMTTNQNQSQNQNHTSKWNRTQNQSHSWKWNHTQNQKQLLNQKKVSLSDCVVLDNVGWDQTMTLISFDRLQSPDLV